MFGSNGSGPPSFTDTVGQGVLLGAALAIGGMLAQAAATAILKWKDEWKAGLEKERAEKLEHDRGHLRVVRD